MHDQPMTEEDLGPDPLGHKWLARQEAKRQAEIDKEEDDRRAFVQSVHDENAEKRRAKIAEEAEGLGVPELLAMIQDLQAEIGEIKVRLGMAAPSWARRAKTEDDFGRPFSTERLLDRAVRSSNPGGKLVAGELAGGDTGRLWNARGR